MKSLNQKKREFNEGGKMTGKNMTYKDFLKEKVDAMREDKDAKRLASNKINEYKDKI